MPISVNFKPVRTWEQRSLANTFALRAALIAIVSSLVVALISLAVIYWVEQVTLDERLQEKASRLAERVEASIGVVESAAYELSKSSMFMTALLDSRGRETYVVPFVANYRFPVAAASGLALCDLNSERLAGMRTDLSECRAKSPLFTKVIAEGKTLRELSPLKNGHLAWTVYQGVVLPYTGTVEGVVVTRLDLHDVLHSLPKDLDVDSVALVRTDTSESLVSVNASEPATPSPSLARARLFTGKSDAAPYPLDVVVMDRSSPFEHKLMPLVVGYGLGSLLLVLAVVYWVRTFARQSVKPLSELTDVAQQIAASGNLSIAVPRIQAGEVGHLSHAFEVMVSTLRISEATLESKVEQRTDSLLQSEARIRSILEGAADAIFITDQQGRYRYANKKASQLLGYDQDELLQLSLADITPAEDLAAVLARFAGLLGDGSLLAEYRLRRKDGGLVPVELNAILLPDGSVFGSCRDITERKQSEMELLRSNSELEQFSYSISHDMRQPLRMISSYLKLIEMGLGEQLDDAKREYFNFAIDGAKRLDQMLVGLLDYSRVGRKGEPPAWVESRDLLDEALRFLQPAMAEAQAELRIEGDWPRVLVSPDEMLRLMQNLLANALKFRLAGRQPELCITSEVVGEYWRLCFADNGIGILPEQSSRLFQVFQRLQSRAAYEGTGIGLALCRKIAEHHGGRIWVRSAGEGQGSRFCVDIPQPAATST